jgi:uncharacterized protein
MNTLSDEEMQALDEFLSGNQPGEVSDIEMLDGFLSAIVVAPRLVPPAAWLPYALGDGERVPDEAAADRIVDLVMRVYNGIVARVSKPLPDESEELDDADLPWIAVPEEDLAPEATEPPIGSPWALGFLMGRELDPEAWARHCADWEGLAEDLESVDELLAGLEDGAAGPTLPMSDRFDTVIALPALLHDLYAARWPPEPLRREAPKVGRNDDCPCGSGRKYKKCCGAG